MKCSKKETDFVWEENRGVYSDNMLAEIETNNISQKRCHNVLSHYLGNINWNTTRQMKEGAYSNRERWHPASGFSGHPRAFALQAAGMNSSSWAFMANHSHRCQPRCWQRFGLAPPPPAAIILWNKICQQTAGRWLKCKILFSTLVWPWDPAGTVSSDAHECQV